MVTNWKKTWNIILKKNKVKVEISVDWKQYQKNGTFAYLMQMKE